MADYAQFVRGGVTYPLTSSTQNEVLLDADPAVWYALDYFASVLQTYIGARFTAEWSTFQPGAVPGSAGVQPPSIVQYRMPMPPPPEALESQIGFPLLAVYRTGGKFEERTVTWEHDMTEWMVEWVLPPLTAAQAERILPLRKAVKDVLRDRIENTFDPSYQSGLKVWAAAGIESIRLTDDTYGGYDFPGNLYFPSWKGTLLVKERQMPSPPSTFSTFQGLDGAIDLTNATDPVVKDFIDPSFTYIDPTTFTNLVGFYRADAGVTMASDAVHVGSVVDQSGTNNSLGAPTTGPVLEAGAIQFVQNGATVNKPVFRFDNLSQLYLEATVPQLSNDGGKTIVALARALNTATRQAIVSHTATSDTGAHTSSIAVNVTSTAGNRMGFEAAGSSFDLPLPTDTSWHVFAVREQSTTSGGTISTTVDVHVDSTVPQPLTLKSGAGTWSGMGGSNLITIGGNPGDANTFAAIDVGVVMVFNASISTSQLTSAMKYCRQWMGNYS